MHSQSFFYFFFFLVHCCIVDNAYIPYYEWPPYKSHMIQSIEIIIIVFIDEHPLSTYACVSLFSDGPSKPPPLFQLWNFLTNTEKPGWVGWGIEPHHCLLASLYLTSSHLRSSYFPQWFVISQFLSHELLCLWGAPAPFWKQKTT